MSKHSMNHTYSSVVFDTQTKTVEQLIEKYGIEISDDGSVYDTCELKEFNSLAEWAAYLDLQETDQTLFEKRGNRHRYDDED